ncbi:MAG TPA: VWA domain-containing protein [Polyangiaceae bacterium]|nr:VWA domain-containing protein [Polyangiaceae bacterium]
MAKHPRARRLIHTLGALATSVAVGLVAGAAGMPTPEASAQTRPEVVPGAGLDAHSENGGAQALPLLSEQLTVRIDGEHAAANYEHVFQNETSSRLEGNYHLLVGEGGTATGFAYWNGNDKIVGEVFEREAAQHVYEAMTGLKRDPGLLEQTGEGAFSFHVFPIESGEKKKIQVSTSRWLRREAGTVTYRASIVRADAKIGIDIDDARGVKSVTSSTHELDVQQVSPTHAHVTVKSAKETSPTELVLAYAPNEAPWTLNALVHHDAGHEVYFTASMATPAAPANQVHGGNDVTLVLDRSGSMTGDSIASARTAAAAIVDKLGGTDTVNVIAFDDKVEKLWNEPHAVTDDARRDAKAYISKIDARGGTDIALALKESLGAQRKSSQPDATGRVNNKVLLMLTDGESDGPSAIKAAQDDTSSARVFTVGIGTGVDKGLLSRLAAIRHGRFTFISDIHAVAIEFPRVLSQLEDPVLTDVTLRAEGATLDRTYPGTLGDLFPSDELRIFGRMNGTGPAKLVIEGKDHGVAKRFETAIDAAATPSAPFVARSWARARVDEILGDISEKGETDALKNEAIELGLAYELVTPYTSFLAVPEKELTDSASQAIGDMRAKRAKILAANKDAAALSRLNMPPGDPVLKVSAPRDARRVTAMFPFGVSQDLAYDDFSESWMTRFLVPKDVPDGNYTVPVVIVQRDGTVTATSVQYTIDSKAPAIEVDVRARTGHQAELRVTLDEPALEVRAADADDPAKRTALAKNPDGTFGGMLSLSPGHHRIRVVVADQARNEAERVVEVDVE